LEKGEVISSGRKKKKRGSSTRDTLPQKTCRAIVKTVRVLGGKGLGVDNP